MTGEPMADMAILHTGPRDAARIVVLAHGAGAPMDSPFMTALAQALARHGIAVARFEFPYMAKRRQDGRKRPPDRMPVLTACFEAAVAAVRARHDGALFVGGKSMGGRVASMIAPELGARGCAVFGYPFHPPGKPDRPRVEHLAAIETPVLIVQGTRDPFGKPREVAAYALSPAVRLAWIDQADHDLKPRKSTGLGHHAAIDKAAHHMALWAAGYPDTAPEPNDAG